MHRQVCDLSGALLIKLDDARIYAQQQQLDEQGFDMLWKTGPV